VDEGAEDVGGFGRDVSADGFEVFFACARDFCHRAGISGFSVVAFAEVSAGSYSVMVGGEASLFGAFLQ